MTATPHPPDNQARPPRRSQETESMKASRTTPGRLKQILPAGSFLETDVWRSGSAPTRLLEDTRALTVCTALGWFPWQTQPVFVVLALIDLSWSGKDSGVAHLSPHTRPPLETFENVRAHSEEPDACHTLSPATTRGSKPEHRWDIKASAGWQKALICSERR